MSPNQQPVRFVLNNRLSELDRLVENLDLIKNQWQLTDKFIMQLNLVLDELFTNIVSYGYDGKSIDEITFILQMIGNEIQVTICDNAKPFDPTMSEDPHPDTSLDNKEIGGLGIFIARHYTDSIDYRRKDKKNIVILTKKL